MTEEADDIIINVTDSSGVYPASGDRVINGAAHNGNAENGNARNGNVSKGNINNGKVCNGKAQSNQSKGNKTKSGQRSQSKGNSNFSTLSRLRRRDKSEVSVVIKYIVFGCNVIFWLIGAFLIAIGAWAAIQKDISSNLASLSSSAFDPVVPIIIVGCVVFVVGFFGCIGALRENTYLLLAYIILLTLILLLLIIAVIIVFGFKDWLKKQITKSGLNDILPKYRDDIDLQNFIDWVQGDWLECCGIIDHNDWNVNIYFNCSDKSPSLESCGFPFSCCIRDKTQDIINKQCGILGYNRTREDVQRVIHEFGCIKKGEDWVHKYIVPIAGVIVAVAVILILSIGFALVLRGDINAQKAKWITTRL